MYLFTLLDSFYAKFQVTFFVDTKKIIFVKMKYKIIKIYYTLFNFFSPLVKFPIIFLYLIEVLFNRCLNVFERILKQITHIGISIM